MVTDLVVGEACPVCGCCRWIVDAEHTKVTSRDDVWLLCMGDHCYETKDLEADIEFVLEE